MQLFGFDVPSTLVSSLALYSVLFMASSTPYPDRRVFSVGRSWTIEKVVFILWIRCQLNSFFMCQFDHLVQSTVKVNSTFVTWINPHIALKKSAKLVYIRSVYLFT